MANCAFFSLKCLHFQSHQLRHCKIRRCFVTKRCSQENNETFNLTLWESRRVSVEERRRSYKLSRRCQRLSLWLGILKLKLMCNVKFTTTLCHILLAINSYHYYHSWIIVLSDVFIGYTKDDYSSFDELYWTFWHFIFTSTILLLQFVSLKYSLSIIIKLMSEPNDHRSNYW
jgi:hypothetical protein